ncbi:MAG: CD1247 N-terminal domain-containing protein [Tumebacillaceae bacterium]
MHQIKEKMAYLKGLAEGLNVGTNSPEGRVLVGIMDVMNEMISSLDRLHLLQDQLEGYIEAVDDDLTDLENEFFDEYDEDLELDDENDTAIEYMEMTCPSCGETVFVDEEVFENDEVVEVLCPECNETVLVNDNTDLVSGTDDELLVDEY